MTRHFAVAISSISLASWFLGVWVRIGFQIEPDNAAEAYGRDDVTRHLQQPKSPLRLHLDISSALYFAFGIVLVSRPGRLTSLYGSDMTDLVGGPLHALER
jgi:hypothetical protein